MRVIDNSGKGSCMYYAYAISLIYHLKSLGPEHGHQKPIFALLNLNTAEEKILSDILEKPGFFSGKDLRKIEFILEPKLRELAAEKMITDFLSNPLNSSLYTAAAYKFRKEVKAKIEKTHPDLASLIEIQDYLGNFSEAEIYRVPGIHGAIDAYTTELAKKISEEVTRLKQAAQPELAEPAELDEHAEQARTLKAIDEFFQQNIVHFFRQNEQEYLTAYLDRLKNPSSWGTEEALNTIHRVITADGPRLIEERWEDKIDRPINFKIFYNGSPAILYSADENPDLILDNLGNNHWVSQIPAKKDLQILLIDNPDDETIRAILARSDEIDASLKTYLAKPLAASIKAEKDKSQEKTLKTSLAIATAALKEKLLTELLDQIQAGKPIDLEKNYSYQQLIECKRVFEFITDDNHDQTAKIEFLKLYEEQAKSNPTGWETFGKFIKGFLLASLSTVLGTLVGAAIGGALGSAAGPGGSLVGAIWGAFKGGNIAVLAGTGTGGLFGSTLWILQMLQPTNAVQDYAAQARKAVQSSLEYRVVRKIGVEDIEAGGEVASADIGTVHSDQEKVEVEIDSSRIGVENDEVTGNMQIVPTF